MEVTVQSNDNEFPITTENTILGPFIYSPNRW